MNLKEKYAQLIKSNSAIIAANFYNLETLNGLLVAARELNTPIILQLSKNSINYIGIHTAVTMAKAAVKEHKVEAWLHLDHGDSLEIVETCLKAGFDSVMIDGSELPFEANIEFTSKAVKLAKKYKVPVEAELGYIAKLDQEQNAGDYLTSCKEAQLFVEKTNVDALAISIGTAHGFYRETPELDFTRLRLIKETLPNTILVLHGSSGIPHSEIKKAIELGINKINIATEFKNAFIKTLKEVLSTTDNIDLRQTFPEAINEVTKLAKTKLQLAG